MVLWEQTNESIHDNMVKAELSTHGTKGIEELFIHGPMGTDE
jgi:hypothetical protein